MGQFFGTDGIRGRVGEEPITADFFLKLVANVIEKKSDYYYFNLYLQSTDRSALHQMLATFHQHINTIKLKSGVRWYLDVDPIE